MFDFWKRSTTNEDAVTLKILTDLVISRYANLDYDSLTNIVSTDFDKNHHYIDNKTITFSYSELEEFHFTFSSSRVKVLDNYISVSGRGKYAGFLLQIIDGKKMHCSVSDGMIKKSTNSAKKIAKILQEKYGIRDLSYLSR
jgi:hypothetical protein